MFGTFPDSWLAHQMPQPMTLQPQRWPIKLTTSDNAVHAEVFESQADDIGEDPQRDPPDEPDDLPQDSPDSVHSGDLTTASSDNLHDDLRWDFA